ncbi:MAG: PAS domain S-box protein [Gemmataceae bacterium]
MKRSLSRSLILGAAMLASVLLGGGALCWWTLQHLHQEFTNLVQIRIIDEATNDVMVDLTESLVGIRGFLLTHRQEFLRPYHQSQANLEQDLQRLNQEAALFPELVPLVSRLASLSHRMQQLHQEVLNRFEANPSISKLSEVIQQTKVQMDEARGVVQQIHQHIVTYQREQAVRSAQAKMGAQWTLAGLVLAALMLTCLFTWAIGQAIRNQKRILQETTTSAARLQAIASSVPGTLFCLDAAGRYELYLQGQIPFVDASQTTRPPTIWLESVVAEERTEAQRAFHHSLDQNTPLEFRHHMPSPTGSPRWAITRAVPVIESEGTSPRWYGIIFDVDEEIQTQEQLKEIKLHLEAEVATRTRNLEELNRALVWNERQLHREMGLLQAILDSVSDAVVAADLEGQILLSNYAARMDLYGDQAGPDSLAEFQERIRLFDPHETTPLPHDALPLLRAMRGEEVNPCELLIRKSSGSGDQFVTVSARPVRAPSGSLLGGVAVLRNITQQKQAERKLQESEATFRTTFEQAPSGMALVSPEGATVQINQALCHLLGYPPEELLAKNLLDLAHPEDRDNHLSQCHALFSGELRSYQVEKRFLRSDGAVVYTLLSVALVRDPLGLPLRFIIKTNDITRLKEVESQLADREVMLQQLIQHIPANVAMFDLHMNYLQASQRWIQDHDMESMTWMGRCYYDLFPGIPPEIRQLHLRALQGHAERNDEYWLDWPGVMPMWMAWECQPWRTAQGEIGGIIIFAQNITRRKQEQERLQRSEARYRSLAEASNLLLWSTNPAGDIDTENPAWQRFTGLTFEEARGHGWAMVVHPEDLPSLQVAWDRSTRDKTPYHTMARVRRSDGEYRLMDIRGVPVLDAQGQVVEWIGTDNDITDKHRAEEALKRSEARFRSLTLASSMIVWTANSDGRVVEPSRTWQQFTGQTDEEVLGLGWTACLHPDDRPNIYASWMAALERRSPCEDVARVLRSDGTYRYLEMRGVPVLTSTGELVEWVGTCNDISEKKQASDLLRESEERLQAFLNNSFLIAWIKDQEYRHIFHSDNFMRRFHLDNLAWQGKTDFELWPEPIARTYRQNDEPVMATGNPIEVVEEAPRPDGTITYWLCHKFRFVSADGKFLVGGIGVDISDRKRTEEMLTRSLHEKEIMLREIHHRVKNNLQIISTLLDLQAREATHPEALAILRDCRSRVKTMALIHERLYRSENLARVNFKDYLVQLVSHLRQSYQLPDRNIHIEIQANIPELPLDVAVPCALMLNELVSNAFKHAFIDRTAGTIWIDMNMEASGVVGVLIRDDGRGLPEGFHLEECSTFGIQLARMLASQLKGELSVLPGPHTCFSMQFPLPTQMATTPTGEKNHEQVTHSGGGG